MASLSTISLSCALVVLAIVSLDSLFFKPLPFKNASSLIVAGPTTPRGELSPVTPRRFARWRENATQITHVFATVPLTHSFQLLDGTAFEVAGAGLTRGAFESLQVRGLRGRGFTDGDYLSGAEPVIVLNESLATRIEGRDPAALLDAVITLATFESRKQYRVVGLVAAALHLRKDNVDQYYVPIDDTQVTTASSSRAVQFLLFGRLDGDSTIQAAAAELQLLATDPSAPLSQPVRVTTIRRYLLGSLLAALAPVLAGSAALLAVGCVNISALLLSRSASQTPQLFVRAALGATRRRIAAHVLADTVVLWVFGSAAGLLIGFAAVRILRASATPGSELGHLGMRWLVAVGLILIFVIIGVISALVPIVRLSKSAVSGGYRRQTDQRGVATQAVLCALQVAMVVALLSSAGLIIQSVQNLTRVKLGFDATHLLAARLRFDARYYGQAGLELQQSLKRQLRAIPGVIEAGWTSELPLSRIALIRGRLSSGEAFESGFRIVDSDYFSALAASPKMAEQLGRFDATDRVAVVNQAFANTHLGPNPIGSRIFIDEWREVVAVVDDIHEPRLNEAVGPFVYWPFSGRRWMSGAPWVVVRTRDANTRTSEHIQTVVREATSGVALIEFTTLNQRFEDQLRPVKFLGVTLSAFSLVATGVAVCGVFGTAAYGASRRLREFGVRLALGATPNSLLGVIARQAMMTAAMGALLGALISYWTSQWLQAWAFGVPSFDTGRTLTASAFLIMLATVAAVGASVRAVAVDPSASLRAE